MINLILKIIQWIITLALVAFNIALIEYVTRAKSVKPSKGIRKNAIIEKYRINKKRLYKVIPKEKSENNFDILYFHGGAYTGGINKGHWDFIESMLKDTNANIFVPDYPLIPKNTYKDVFDMAEEIYKNYIQKDNFIVIGDSAGGGISLAFSQKLGIENEILPKKIILISPWLDITMKNEQIDRVQEKDTVLNKKMLKLAGNLYCGKENHDNYLVSPINGPTDKINNISIFTGTYDILNPDVAILKEKIKDKEIYIYEKQKAKHNWILEPYKYEEDYQNFIKTILK